MTRWGSVAIILALLVAAAGSGAAQPSAAPVQPSPAAQALDRFLGQAGPTCDQAPSNVCVDAGFRFADTDHDGRLSVAELERVRAAIGDWMAWRGGSLPEDAQSRVAFGIMIVDTLGIPAIVASYDQDGDGQLTKQEAVADVRLDHRTLAEVLADPASVNRVALQQRLGVMGAMTENVFPQ